MDYISQMNGFERWLEVNYLPIPSQLLWYKLVGLCNRCGWAEWVTVDNQRLMAVMQMRREATFIDVRDKLVDAGLVEYRKGKKGCPNKYKLCTFNSVGNTVVNTAVNTVTYTAPYAVAYTVDINKQDNTRQIPKKDANASKEKFTPPSLAEVTAYCTERQNTVNPEQWQDFYTSNGWMVGKSKMKDWKASVRTWERRGSQNSPKQNKSAQTAGSSIDMAALDAYINGQFADSGRDKA